jgi:hypothetical protein
MNPFEVQRKVYECFKTRNSLIRIRKDDYEQQPLINKSYPYLVCSDPEFEDRYWIKLVFGNKDSPLVSHHLKFKGFL